MDRIYDEEALVALEQEEHSLTEEALLVMLAILATTKSDLERELRAFYQKYGTDGVVTYAEARKWVDAKDHRRRIAVLMLFLSSEFSGLRSKLHEPFYKMVTSVLDKESAFFDVPLDDVSLKWGADDLTWVDRLEDDITLWLANVSGDVKRGILRREEIEDILEMLDKRFSTMESVLTGLAITETTAVGTIARREIFEELGIEDYRFYTREDERVCETCGSMHGLTFPVSAYEPGVTASPLHPRCRCFEIPIRG